MQVGTPPRLSHTIVRDHVGSLDNHTQQVGLLVPLATAHTGAHRSDRTQV